MPSAPIRWLAPWCQPATDPAAEPAAQPPATQPVAEPTLDPFWDTPAELESGQRPSPAASSKEASRAPAEAAEELEAPPAPLEPAGEPEAADKAAPGTAPVQEPQPAAKAAPAPVEVKAAPQPKPAPAEQGKAAPTPVQVKVPPAALARAQPMAPAPAKAPPPLLPIPDNWETLAMGRGQYLWADKQEAQDPQGHAIEIPAQWLYVPDQAMFTRVLGRDGALQWLRAQDNKFPLDRQSGTSFLSATPSVQAAVIARGDLSQPHWTQAEHPNHASKILQERVNRASQGDWELRSLAVEPAQRQLRMPDPWSW